ncbi:MAG: DUF4912 domain-containing protein [Gammaproteobacteria bacterium]|nr:DUF4912 domain-containing protein [Gammaproteobacteria bacterium]
MQDSDPNPTQIPDKESLRSLEEALKKHFPRPIEQTELVLLDVSPRRLHAYWHITPWELKAAEAGSRGSKTRLILRFHDLTQQTRKQESSPSFDIEISGASGSQYVELWEDAKRYRAELGLLLDDGRLIDLARSNTVELPKAKHSPQQGGKTLTLTPTDKGLIEAQPQRAATADAIQKAREAWRVNDAQPNDATLQAPLNELFPLFPDPSAPPFEAHRLHRIAPRQATASREISATDEELELTPSKGSPMSAAADRSKEGPTGPSVTTELKAHGEIRQDGFPLCSVQDARKLVKTLFEPLVSQEPTGFETIAPSGSLESGATELRFPSISRASPANSSEWTEQDGFPLCSIQDARDLLKDLIEPRLPEASQAIVALEIPTGFAFAPAGPRPFRPANPRPSGGIESASDRAADSSAPSSPVSSFTLLQDPDEELHIELHIHGRARPNSHFVFHGQHITTEADGSFSLHKELPLASQRFVALLLAGKYDREA